MARGERVVPDPVDDLEAIREVAGAGAVERVEALPGAASTCYAEVVGIWSYNPFIDEYGLFPLAGGATGTCE